MDVRGGQLTAGYLPTAPDLAADLPQISAQRSKTHPRLTCSGIVKFVAEPARKHIGIPGGCTRYQVCIEAAMQKSKSVESGLRTSARWL